MNGKSNLSWRIGMIMMLLCAALVMAVFPVAADYTADKPLTEYKNGTITGDMNYTIGNSSYSPKIWSNNTNNIYVAALPQNVPSGATVVEARLYEYFTWSYDDDAKTGVSPLMTVTFDGTSFNNPSASYTDTKGSGTYNYPSGTYCYNVTNLINSSSTTDHIVTVHNRASPDCNISFNSQAIGLVVVYNASGSNVTKHYWIDEGCDMLNCRWNTNLDPDAWDYGGITPENATAIANFSNVNNYGIDSAYLITTVPSGGTLTGGQAYNKLFFNNANWTSIWDGNPRDSNFSWENTSISCYDIQSGLNIAKFRDGWDSNTHYTDGQMQAANAFLVITYS